MTPVPVVQVLGSLLEIITILRNHSGLFFRVWSLCIEGSPLFFYGCLTRPFCAAQVEHPVTEMISGVNIPAAQMMIGMGIPLYRIPDIRNLFGKDPNGASAINFETDPQIDPLGRPT